MRPLNDVYCCDFKELLAEFPDKAIDLLLVDPPFGQNIGKMNFTRSVKGGIAKRNDYSAHNLKWDETTLTAADVQELFRVSKNQVIFGANYFANLLPPSRCWYAWDKKTADKYTNDFADMELIWTSFSRPARVIRWLWHGMIQQDMKYKEKRLHPTMKPQGIMRRLVEDFSNPGDLICDCFCGAGGTLVAAKELERRYIGCDLDPNYVNITKERLNQQLAIAA